MDPVDRRPLDPAGTPASGASGLLRPVPAMASMPPESPLDMPVQSFWKKPQQTGPVAGTATPRDIVLARLFVFGAALLLTVYGGFEMFQVINVGQITPLKWTLLALFIVNFSWIALAFTSALLGFWRLWSGREKLPSIPEKLTTRTAVVLPVYNEHPRRIFAGLLAMIRDVHQMGHGDSFDWYILSDTTDPAIWIEEERMYLALQGELPAGVRLYYRHRPKNTARKAGNVADFVSRWGGACDHFVPLDADSLMDGRSLVTLVAAMEADPGTGIIQTLPFMISRNTVLARLQQFAGRMYGPVIAGGLAAWSGRSGNYWGHNAIIRTKAFAAHCALPVLRGKPPLGGHILSHDFVEAALMRRAGYSVTMLPALQGSYEESPPSLIDIAIRDRRWCQGNLQHLQIIGARGLSLFSRQHFANGIMSYLASPIWLAQLVVGILLVLQSYYIRPEYFTDEFSFLPVWPQFDAERALALFGITMAVLFAPKIFGLILALRSRDIRRGSGGGFRLTLSAILEAIATAMIAPIMMVIQTGSVIRILRGSDAGWNPQARDDGSIPFMQVVRRHYLHVVLGVVTLLAAFLVAPSLAAWMSPTIAGLLLAIVISWMSGQQAIGMFLRRAGLLLIPEETNPPHVALMAREIGRRLQETGGGSGAGSDRALRALAEDAAFRDAHLAMLPEPSARQPGQVEPDAAVARAKLEDAQSLEDAAAWLSPGELRAVLLDRALVARLVALHKGAPFRHSPPV